MKASLRKSLIPATLSVLWLTSTFAQEPTTQLPLQKLGLECVETNFKKSTSGTSAASDNAEVLATLHARSRRDAEVMAQDPEGRYRYLYSFSPRVAQDLHNGKIYLDLRLIKEALLPGLAQHKPPIHPDQMILEVDGGAVFKGQDIPVDMARLNAADPYVSYAGGPVNRQQYVRVAFLEKGKYVHVTDNAMIENQNFARIDSKGYAGKPQAEADLPGIDTHLVALSGKITDANKIPGINPDPKFKKLQEAFALYGPDFHPYPIHDKTGSLTGWKVELPPGSGKFTLLPPEAIEERVDAAFSQHGFRWDSEFGSEALADSDPKTALNTLVEWLKRRDKNGWFYRESDYKGSPYHRKQNVKFGVTTLNRETFNPPLMGWAWDEVLRYNPKLVAPHMKDALQAMKDQLAWFRDPKNGVAEVDEQGRLIGLKHTNLGSGEDNAPIPLDEFGMDALPKYGIASKAAPGREKAGLSGALLSQYLITLKTVQKFEKIQGKFADAQKHDREIQEVTDLLRSRYRNKDGWYGNLVPVGQHGWELAKRVKPSGEIAPIETLGGFWAIAAGVARPHEIQQLLDTHLLNPEKFGGIALTSVPRDNPYFKLEGGYWEGGIWPPQLRMISRALQDNGFRGEASYFDQLHMKAMNSASKADQEGDTPAFLIEYLKAKWAPDGAAPGASYEDRRNHVLAAVADYNKMMSDAKAESIRKNSAPRSEGTIHETLGIQHDSQGKEVVSYGIELRRRDGTLHETRRDFAGWGMVVPKTIARSSVRDAAHAFQGPADQVDRWLYENLTDPAFYLRNRVRSIPVFKPLVDFLNRKPKATAVEFRNYLNGLRSPEMTRQIALFRQGYMEISPTLNPGEGRTVLRNYTYDGKPYEMRVDNLADGTVNITVNGPKMRAQFNRMWEMVGGNAIGMSVPQDSSALFEIGGDQPVVILKKGQIERIRGNPAVNGRLL
jgi:hypothetical protein